MSILALLLFKGQKKKIPKHGCSIFFFSLWLFTGINQVIETIQCILNHTEEGLLFLFLSYPYPKYTFSN